jgi:hypothetical protein
MMLGRNRPRRSLVHFVVGDGAGVWIDVKLVLLAVLHAFAFPVAIIRLDLGNVAVAGSRQIARA